MALSKDSPRLFRGAVTAPDILEPVVNADIVYLGAALSDAGGAGVVGPLVGTEVFRGFAMANRDNSAGAAGALKVPVRRKGEVYLAIAGTLAQTDIGVTVYASDDGTFTKTATANCAIGKLVEFVSTTHGWVAFEADPVRSI